MQNHALKFFIYLFASITSLLHFQSNTRIFTTPKLNNDGFEFVPSTNNKL